MTTVEEEWFVCTYVAAGMQGMGGSMEGGGACRAWEGGGHVHLLFLILDIHFVVSD
jgi:hypothetical protein